MEANPGVVRGLVTLYLYALSAGAPPYFTRA